MSEEIKAGDRFETRDSGAVNVIKDSHQVEWWRVRFDRFGSEGLASLRDFREWRRLPREDEAPAPVPRIVCTHMRERYLPCSTCIQAAMWGPAGTIVEVKSYAEPHKPVPLAHDFSDRYVRQRGVWACKACGTTQIQAACRGTACMPVPGWREASERFIAETAAWPAMAAARGYDPKADARDPWAQLRELVPSPSRRGL